MSNKDQPIVVTCGDPAGVGPEVAVSAWKALKDEIPLCLLIDPGFLPKNINIKSDTEQTKQTRKICCFFKPCSITKIFCAPIAKIRLSPVKNPKIRNSI